MTCKDCICYEKCKSNRLDFAESAEPTHICQYFKNKADFEKVTRCKDCYNVEDLDGTLYCWYFNKNVYEDDFCSNGG